MQQLPPSQAGFDVFAVHHTDKVLPKLEELFRVEKLSGLPRSNRASTVPRGST